MAISAKMLQSAFRELVPNSRRKSFRFFGPSVSPKRVRRLDSILLESNRFLEILMHCDTKEKIACTLSNPGMSCIVLAMAAMRARMQYRS